MTEVCVLFLLPSVRQGGALALGLCHYRKKLHQFKIKRLKMQNRFLVFFFFVFLSSAQCLEESNTLWGCCACWRCSSNNLPKGAKKLSGLILEAEGTEL